MSNLLTPTRISRIQRSTMPNPKPTRSRRVLVTLGADIDQLLKEAKLKRLTLATYLRSLIATHPERAGGAGNR